MGSRPCRDDISKRVGQRVRNMRHERGITLRTLSDRCGMPIAMLSKVEVGQRRVSVDDLMSLSAGLDVAPSALLVTDLWA